MPNLKLKECACCGTKVKPCPFCGSEAEIIADNMVGCTNNQCEANVDWGHFCGIQNGIPAYHHVLEAWNKRAND